MSETNKPSTFVKQGFVSGAFILMLSNIIVKVIGAAFKIPLVNTIGTEAMSYFNSAYYIYVLFYSVSTAGLPVAISRMIAASNAQGKRTEVKHIFKVSLLLFTVVGTLGTLCMVVFCHQFSALAKNPHLYLSLLAIAPTLFFICIVSAFRGYFQGLQNMIPTGVSQVIEAVGKLALGLMFANYAIQAGMNSWQAAAFAILGVTLGVVASSVYLMLSKLWNKHDAFIPFDSSEPVRTSGSLVKELIRIAIPITISSSIMSLSGVIDTFVVVPRLQSLGLDLETVNKLYGAYTSYSVPLFNMPPNLIYPFSISIIPLLSAFNSKHPGVTANNIIESTLRIASIIALPCTFGLAVLAKPIIALLYKNEALYTNDAGKVLMAYDVSASLLMVLAVSVFFVSIIAVTNSILQSYGFERYTIYSTMLGIVVKLISAYALIGIPTIGLYGTPISTGLMYLTIMILNFYFLIHFTKFKPRLRRTYLKPFVASLVCSVAAFATYQLFHSRINYKIATLIAVAVAAVVYTLVLLLLRSLTSADILLLPKGKFILNLMKKYKLIPKHDVENTDKID